MMSSTSDDGVLHVWKFLPPVRELDKAKPLPPAATGFDRTNRSRPRHWHRCSQKVSVLAPSLGVGLGRVTDLTFWKAGRSPGFTMGSLARKEWGSVVDGSDACAAAPHGGCIWRDCDGRERPALPDPGTQPPL